MPWYMPSYGRALQINKLEAAPGGWPHITLLLNEDDPDRQKYRRAQLIPWQLCFIPAGSRCADAHRFISERWPNESFYGLLCDDQWPITPGWWEAMEDAAGRRYISTPAGEPSFPRCRTAVCLGGDLVRAMGSLVPAPLKHNFEDNIWDDVAQEFSLLRPLPNFVVEHRHHTRGTAPNDPTYQRGSADFLEDQSIYEAWLISDDKKAMDVRIRAMLAANADHGGV